MATQAALAASERAMQMICSTICNGEQKWKQMWDIEKIVNAWVHHPDKLTPDAMKEDLPEPRATGQPV
jgi:uncharacterized protein with LGFP repeats